MGKGRVMAARKLDMGRKPLHISQNGSSGKTNIAACLCRKMVKRTLREIPYGLESTYNADGDHLGVLDNVFMQIAGGPLLNDGLTDP